MPINEELVLEAEKVGQRFHLQYFNGSDRLTVTPKQPNALPTTYLVPRLKPGDSEPITRESAQISREHIQSAAVFHDLKEYASVKEAFEDADSKVKKCFEILGEHLAELQRALPYLVTWTIYPVSHFDIGVVHHKVDHFCPTSGDWKVVGGAVSMSLARQLQVPLFVFDFKSLPNEPDHVSLAHELLAEAQVALFRGLLRLAVINSFTALETLSNFVFKQQRLKQLKKWGVPEAEATVIAEDERKDHRSDERFLLGEGMKKATGRSLFQESKALYESLLKLEKEVRHEVVHRGIRPDKAKAKEAFRSCCEGVRWLCDVGGFHVKPLSPDFKAHTFQISADSATPHVCSATELETIRRLFGAMGPSPKGEEGTEPSPQ